MIIASCCKRNYPVKTNKHFHYKHHWLEGRIKTCLQDDKPANEYSGCALGFFNEFRLQLHRTKTFNLAIDIMVAFHQPDILDLGADFHHRG